LISVLHRTKCLLILVMSLALSVGVRADETYLQATCAMDFPEAMAHLQDSIQDQEYTVSRIQHVDKGLIERGYETEKYKVVFFGKPNQMAKVASNYPSLIPFVPLNITISQEGGRATVSTLAPKQFSTLGIPADAEPLISHWQRDVEEIVRRYSTCQPDVF